MKALFPDVSNPGTGKGFFLQGLVDELRKLKVDIIFDRNKPHDVSLENIRIRNKTTAPMVVRFDGVYHNTAIDWKRKNEGMVIAAKAATKIICQSQFGREMVVRYLSADPKKITIINNASVKSVEIKSIGLINRNNFIAVAVWRPHKRLKETIEGFLAADIPDSILRIFGKLGKGMDNFSFNKYPKDRVVYMDQMTDRSNLLAYMHLATAMIHLCWFDCCPNSVVEAINQRCPVICNNVGGTKEIVYPSNGIVLELDEPYDYKPVDLYNPPPIDINKLAEAIRSVSINRPKINNEHVNIENVAWRYKNVLESAMAI